MPAMADVHRYVEVLCCYYNRETLEAICGWFYEEKTKKTLRPKLEQTAFTIETLAIKADEAYTIKIGDREVKTHQSAKAVVAWISKNTFYNWFEEPEYPTLKTTGEKIQILKEEKWIPTNSL